MHAVSKTVETPLVDVPYEQLCPGNTALQELMKRFR
jgi:2-oxoglutarate ferredoxin oxidoreductase subunit beta